MITKYAQVTLLEGWCFHNYFHKFVQTNSGPPVSNLLAQTLLGKFFLWELQEIGNVGFFEGTILALGELCNVSTHHLLGNKDAFQIRHVETGEAMSSPVIDIRFSGGVTSV